jgi:hypothetical protein
MVAPDADVDARVEPRAALPDDDVTGNNCLAAKHLDAKALRLRIATVLAATACFLVCHFASP